MAHVPEDIKQSGRIQYIESLHEKSGVYEKMLETMKRNFVHASTLSTPSIKSRTALMKRKGEDYIDSIKNGKMKKMVSKLDSLQNYAQNVVIPRLSLLSTMMEHAFVMAQVNGAHYLTPEFKTRVDRLENEVMPVIENYNKYATAIHRKFNLPSNPPQKVKDEQAETLKFLKILFNQFTGDDDEAKANKKIINNMIKQVKEGYSFDDVIYTVAGDFKDDLMAIITRMADADQSAIIQGGTKKITKKRPSTAKLKSKPTTKKTTKKRPSTAKSSTKKLTKGGKYSSLYDEIFG